MFRVNPPSTRRASNTDSSYASRRTDLDRRRRSMRLAGHGSVGVRVGAGSGRACRLRRERPGAQRRWAFQDARGQQHRELDMSGCAVTRRSAVGLAQLRTLVVHTLFPRPRAIRRAGFNPSVTCEDGIGGVGSGTGRARASELGGATRRGRQARIAGAVSAHGGHMRAACVDGQREDTRRRARRWTREEVGRSKQKEKLRTRISWFIYAMLRGGI